MKGRVPEDIDEYIEGFRFFFLIRVPIARGTCTIPRFIGNTDFR